MGDVDDSLRHAITKLAHVHLAASRDAARRVRRLGEDPRRIFVVGAPGLDEILAVRKPTRAWLQRTLNWTRPESYAVIVQHPSGRSAERERRDMRATLAAVSDAGLSGVIAYPNSDPGFSGIVAEIEATIRNGRVARTASDRPLNWHAARSFTRETYLRLLKGAAVLVGNSSSGIIESCCAGVPAVNIGDRQKGRLACGASVVHCRGDRPSILRAIQRAMRRQAGSDNSVYGDGQAGPRIATILARVPLDAAFRRKLITY
jgi:UDP-hydrolysing UDP-N-acetyl-D-glucosamine 2-epimerase